jgi:diadenosine tetraphosphatase ApaH/serine/threonine PP2A family protein phosphatase
MRIAILSDIHANREAFDACLRHAERQGFDRLIFLGDLVGYGADPVYVVDRVIEAVAKGAQALRGNHDAAAAAGSAEGMNAYAGVAIEWTHAALDAGRRAFLAQLPLTIEEGDRLFVHAEASSPREWRYVADVAGAERSLFATDKRLTFCGHTHRPQIYHMAHNRPPVPFTPQAGVPTPFIGHRKWLAVLGSVGQPRDHDPAASYAMFDVERSEITYLRAPYDIEKAAEKIHAAGLPNILAARLFVGR